MTTATPIADLILGVDLFFELDSGSLRLGNGVAAEENSAGCKLDSIGFQFEAPLGSDKSIRKFASSDPAIDAGLTVSGDFSVVAGTELCTDSASGTFGDEDTESLSMDGTLPVWLEIASASAVDTTASTGQPHSLQNRFPRVRVAPHFTQAEVAVEVEGAAATADDGPIAVAVTVIAWPHCLQKRFPGAMTAPHSLQLRVGGSINTPCSGLLVSVSTGIA